MRSLTGQLVILLTLALLPLGLISVYQTRAVVDEAERLNQAALQAETESAAAAERELIREALGAAKGMSALGLEELRDECDSLLAEFVRFHPRFAYAGFADPMGNIVCASRATGINILDSEAFQGVVESGGPHIELVGRGRVTGIPVVVVADAVQREGAVEGYVMISIPSRIADALLNDESTERGLHLAAINNRGQVISATGGTETAEAHMPTGVLPEALFDRIGDTFEGWSNDGERRVFAISEIVPGSAAIVGSWPAAVAVDGHALWRARLSVTFPLLMWLAGMGVAFFGVQRLVIRHVSALASAMRQHALGRLSGGRIELDRPPDELKAAETAFNRMILLLAQAEAKQEQDLRDKEVLLREVHHRVKNNLQLIASIMNMQSRLTHSKEARRILADLQRRVRGLATLHRSLYTGAETTTIDAAELIRTLLADLAPLGPESGLEIETDLQEVHLYPDQAVPLSMLFSEAMTNAIKHAGKPDTGPAKIRVTLSVDDDDMVYFMLENTLGERLLPENDFDTGMGGLGTRLMRAFISQLEARAEQEQDERTYRYGVHFKRAEFTNDMRQ
ncbi:sensor histidine kinase [Marinibacterium profundimaris]|uniref:sensor histidine kinase n=1 Tax=Marinibacterium profundimaris TaxID=1679460 RepID=UPI0013039CEA|nr:histidine kinase dimerization/phosphoacceptor domain -containing protein [Marinibacterium profundimaris]